MKFRLLTLSLGLVVGLTAAGSPSIALAGP